MDEVADRQDRSPGAPGSRMRLAHMLFDHPGHVACYAVDDHDRARRDAGAVMNRLIDALALG